MDLQLQKLTQKYEQPPFVSFNAAIEIKSKEQEILDREKEEFFSRGGEIESYSTTSVLITSTSAIKPSIQKPNRLNKRMPDNSSLVAYHSRNKPEKKRLNITEKKLVSKTVWAINIAGVFYGSHATEEIAVRIRDEKRKLLNLPSAEY
jgi:hypothetical protein